MDAPRGAFFEANKVPFCVNIDRTTKRSTDANGNKLLAHFLCLSCTKTCAFAWIPPIISSRHHSTPHPHPHPRPSLCPSLLYVPPPLPSPISAGVRESFSDIVLMKLCGRDPTDEINPQLCQGLLHSPC